MSRYDQDHHLSHQTHSNPKSNSIHRLVRFVCPVIKHNRSTKNGSNRAQSISVHNRTYSRIEFDYVRLSSVRQTNSQKARFPALVRLIAKPDRTQCMHPQILSGRLPFSFPLFLKLTFVPERKFWKLSGVYSRELLGLTGPSKGTGSACNIARQVADSVLHSADNFIIRCSVGCVAAIVATRRTGFFRPKQANKTNKQTDKQTHKQMNKKIKK